MNPQNVAAASAAVINDILDYENAQDTIQQLFVFRTLADGPLFAVPGGDVKLAVGLEYQDASAKTRQQNGRRDTLSNLAWEKGGRNTKSVFGELSVPLFTFLDLSASLRHDEYSDFGSTTNPSFGARLKPFEWLSIYGHWSKSFNAPTVLDSFGIATARYIPNSVGVNSIPAQLGLWHVGDGTGVVHATGTSSSLMPQTSENWSIGFDAKPFDGFRFGVNYYAINFDNILGAVDPQQIAAWQANPEKFIVNPTEAEYNAFMARLANGEQLKAEIGGYQNVGYLLDRITSNLTSAKLRGLDFNADYSFGLGNGTMSLGFAGNVQLSIKQNNSGIIRDVLAEDTPKVSVTGNIGWRNDTWSTKMTVNYTGGYRYQTYQSTSSALFYDDISPFITANLFIGYNFGDRGGALDGLSLRLNVDNLFNEKPQVAYQNNSNLAYRNWTLGRVIKLGFSKEF